MLLKLHFLHFLLLLKFIVSNYHSIRFSDGNMLQVHKQTIVINQFKKPEIIVTPRKTPRHNPEAKFPHLEWLESPNQTERGQRSGFQLR